ncbi:LysR family transcriptional regulator [Rhizobium sp. S95]|uniref:LysR family transcriptional regulator n=2 Tax=Alphaproteobacteria TaxID=28211 RepID=A0AAJ1C0L3_9HYPH|nr:MULTISPECIES: LysR family transcriptional regulator [unclassified Ciceribacter]MCM2395983.1 LysR family transcriptional regulator [Ciceribacter sp. S95]MCM2404060.1 LysR family transcriptional regulator [Ciceribacter sp. S153]MCO5959651.1 LysR family transcriptional regulator [Ciceribacter sp. S101]
MSLMNIQLRHIRCLLAVASEKSFARAAEKLSVSQPALSQTIIQLEETLGFEVFERTTRSVSLTKDGATLCDYAQKLNRSMETFYREVKALQLSRHNFLRVGYLIGTAVEFIPKIMQEFERRRPNATLEFVEYDFTNPDAGLSTELVDCSIFRPPVDTPDIRLVEIAREKCVACLPDGHPLSLQETVTVEQLFDEPFIAAPGNGVWRDYWLAGQYRQGRGARVVFEAATVDSELQAVAMRKGISITAESTARFYARPGVTFRRIANMDDCIIAIGHRQPANPLIKELIDVAIAVTRLPADG